MTLEENYRSTQPILDAANALMAESTRQFRKQLEACTARRAKPQYVTRCSTIRRRHSTSSIACSRRASGASSSAARPCCSAARDHSDVLELELMRRNIPYVKYGGLKFLEAAHVKDLLALLRWADNPRNRIAAFRVLQLLPGMGPANAARVCDAFAAAAYRWWRCRTQAVPLPRATRGGADRAARGEIAVEHAGLGGAGAPARQWYDPQLERLYEAGRRRAAAISTSSSACASQSARANAS